MRLFKGGRKDKRNFTRVFFATDLHGSTPTFKKFLSAARVYEADVLVMGGDVSGKTLVPIVDAGNGSYELSLHDERRQVPEAELDQVRGALETQGQYHAIVSVEEYERLRDDISARNELFEGLVRERLAHWRELAEERLEPLGVRCYVTGGNDDESDTLSVLDDAGEGAMVFCEGRLVMIDELHPMISCGWSNRTPWHTPRETSEEELAEKLEECSREVEDASNAVFNIHPPPHDSTLDVCPALDGSTDPPSPIYSGGQPVMTNAGSTAVRQLIERRQPLLGLHGHIHEARGVHEIGRTVVLNPGSEYGEGLLRGCLVNLAEDEVLSFQMTSG